VRAVAETDLLEEAGRPLALQDGTVALEFQPFEIKTLKLEF
jgi:alpha-mannosidase